jgi:hypothetical protein
MTGLFLLAFGAGLWLAVQPASDPVRIRARATGPLSAEDWYAHGREVAERPARWAKEREELAKYRKTGRFVPGSMHLVRTAGRVG